MTRRKFFVTTAAAQARIFGANDRIRVGIIGPGGRGKYLMGVFKEFGADLGAVCDVYQPNLEAGLKLASPGADLPEYQQVFKLNDKELDIYSGLVPKRQFLLKTDRQSKLLNVDLDAGALAEYANSRFEKARRAEMESLATV